MTKQSKLGSNTQFYYFENLPLNIEINFERTNNIPLELNSVGTDLHVCGLYRIRNNMINFMKKIRFTLFMGLYITFQCQYTFPVQGHGSNTMTRDIYGHEIRLHFY